MANEQPNTGRTQVSESIKSAASNLSGPALDLASGASAFQAATNALKGAVLDKLIGPTAFFAGSLIGVLRTIKAIVDQSGILERGLKRIAAIQQIQGKFETILKSAEKAQKRMQELYKFTANSPFDFNDVAEANRILETLTGGALSASRGMKLVGDVAAATNQSFAETAERIGKVYNALRSGRSMDKVMFQLQMTGVITDELARKLETLEQSGATFSQMWAEVENSLQFASGGMANEMKNLDALQTRLNNASKMMEQAFGEPFVDAQAKAMERTVQATQNLTPLLGKIGSDLAPILQWTTLIKGQFYDWILATKGFADTLSFAWTVAKGFVLTLAGTTLASFAGNFLNTASSILEFGRSLKSARIATAAGVEAVAGLAKAHDLFAKASAASAEGNLLSAASLYVQGVAARVVTAVMTLHRTALAAATTATGAFSLAQYVAAAATQVFVGGLKLIGAALAVVGRGIAAFIVANPVLAVGAAAVATAAAFKQLADGIADAAEEFTKFNLNAAKATHELRKQLEAVKNLDEYRKGLADADKREADLTKEIKDLGPRPNPVTIGSGALGIPVIASNADAVAKFDERKKVLGQELIKTRRARQALKDRDLDTIGLSKEEEQAAVGNADKNKRLQEAREQAKIDVADDAEKERLLRKRAARLASEAEAGEAIAKGRLRPEAYKDNLTELMKINRGIAEFEKNKQPIPADLIEKRAQLANLADTYQEKSAQALQDVNEANRLKETLRLKQIELDYDEAIAAVRRVGGETGAAEAAKELAILREQLRIAKEKGEAGKLEARDIKNRIRAKEAEQARFRADTALERAKNEALIARQPRDAQSLQDAADQEKLRDQYKAAGMSAAQADSDFAANILAQAAQAQPRIVSDSLQRVGGGGGSSGASPALAAQQRQLAVQQASRDYLRILAEAAVNGRGLTLR